MTTRHRRWWYPIDHGQSCEITKCNWRVKFHTYTWKMKGIKGRMWAGAWCRVNWKFRDLLWWSHQNLLSPCRWKEKEWFTEKFLGRWSCWGNALRTKKERKCLGFNAVIWARKGKNMLSWYLHLWWFENSHIYITSRTNEFMQSLYSSSGTDLVLLISSRSQVGAWRMSGEWELSLWLSQPLIQ